MASLFGATTVDTPQFEGTEVAEETSPLMGSKSEHIRFGKLHIAMPVVGNRGLGIAPAAAERLWNNLDSRLGLAWQQS